MISNYTTKLTTENKEYGTYIETDTQTNGTDSRA